jgi:hypothetical protein
VSLNLVPIVGQWAGPVKRKKGCTSERQAGGLPPVAARTSALQDPLRATSCNLKAGLQFGAWGQFTVCFNVAALAMYSAFPE